MPATRRPKPLYQRGGFRLFPRTGRNHEIVWYDPAAGRERTASAGTAETEAAKAALDALYLEKTRGVECCPHCLRPFDQERGRLVTEAIELARHDAVGKTSEGAINARLDHVVGYIETLPSPAVLCGDVDERWIKGFRSWAEAQPIVTPSGREKARSISTVENSVLQLAAAIRGVGERPMFKPVPPKEVNRTPEYRADVPMMGAMLRYALEPAKRRGNLLAFLRASIVSLGRPDAVLDVSTAKDRAQWNSERAVLNLNPKGRRQTRKRRAIVPVARQAAWIFDACNGFLIPVDSIKSAWNAMAEDLGLPGDGESGTKLVRRSMADIIRRRLNEIGKPEDELEAFLGHRSIDPVSELYAPFSPAYLGTVKAIIEGIIDELEPLAPGAFYRDLTATGGNVASIGRAKNG